MPLAASSELDRVAVCDVVQRERAARDMMRWDEFGSLYNPDSEVDISWFKGSGAEFVAASRRMAESGVRTFHQMSPTIATLRGDRALTETACAIHLLGTVDGVEVDVLGHSRLYGRVERQTDRWLMSGYRVAYVTDAMIPVEPTGLIKLDPAVLAAYRTSYRYISYLLGLTGRIPRDDLPGLDRPETLVVLEQAEQAWLHAKD